jgi:predicted chitinase
MSGLRLAMLAGLSALACVSGAAEPFGGDPAGSAGSPPVIATAQGGSQPNLPNSSAGSAINVSGAAFGGSAMAAAGTGVTSPGGSGNGTGGTSPSAGGGGSSGGAPSEACDFPAWMAGHDYVKGDKVMYQGQAFTATEANPGYDPLISTYFWAPYDCSPVSSGGSNSGGAGSGGSGNQNGECVLAKLLPNGEATFHAMFIPPWQGHQEKPLYSYSALCQALQGFGQFAASGNVEADKREVAAFFAHVAKETAFLEQTDEAGQPSNAGDFHGRGAIQLTGQANYQAAGEYLNKNLVGSPGMVSTDAVTNWQVALWFWVVHNNPGTPGTKNCHQAIQAGDFAQTTRIINGGIECPGSQSAQTRAQYYQNNCSALQVSPGGNLVC